MEAEIVFSPPLARGILLKRYKRFLADVRLETGRTVTVHCPNTGSMKSCSEPGRPVALSYHPDPGRKHRYTWEMIEMDAGWVGVNTGIPNGLAGLAAQYGLIPEFISFTDVRREVRYGVNSRIDLLLEGPPGRCWVEIKNVTLLEGDAVSFPDAVTERGKKHLEELTRVVQRGDRAAMLFVVQRPEGKVFRAADHIDPAYGESLRRAVDAGVEVLVYRAIVGPDRIRWGDPIPKDFSIPSERG
ncbi:MAG: DNA/RNA nuclease SfsA [Elusimicrobia bacterium]|jgi:sugar fermentation stimulation protein A|nr:DNA/RNA nuclease SfsA [Elusimicrobiota bacterium]